MKKNEPLTQKTFMVIGLGRFGLSIAKNLAAMGCDVLAIDINEEQAAIAIESVPYTRIADSTNYTALETLGTADIDHVVIAIGGNLQASVLTLINLKKLGVKRITVRADETAHKEVYTQLGADQVIIPEEASGTFLSNEIISDSVLDYYPISDTHAIVKIITGPNFKPASIVDLKVRESFGVNIIGIFQNDVFSIPNPVDIIDPGDVLVVVGTKEDYHRFDLFLNS